MNYELIFGRSGKAVGLSAISLLAIFLPRSLKIWARHFNRLSDLATSPSPNFIPVPVPHSHSHSHSHSPIPFPVPVPQSRSPFPFPLAKDAAPIPNALAAIKTRKIPEFQKSVETPQSDVSTIPNSQLLTNITSSYLTFISPFKRTL